MSAQGRPKREQAPKRDSAEGHPVRAQGSPKREQVPKRRFARAAQAYASEFGDAGGLPATWETITAMAWAPEHGAPIRQGGAEIASFPAARIPIRRR